MKPSLRPAVPSAQRYGPHAIHADYGSGWCNVQGPHYHPYPPFDDHLFQENPGGFRLMLSAGGDPAAALEEEVVVDSAARRLCVLRRAGASAQRSSWSAETRGSGTWLLREATLPGAREDLLRNDSLRGRFAGTLAVDLLAWGRLL